MIETIVQVAGSLIVLSMAASAVAATGWLCIIISRDIKNRMQR